MGNMLKARHKLAQASRVAVLTGAGISAESGVPTFRGEDGLWKQYRAEDLATPQAFARDPKLVWDWYHWRRGLMADCKPNPAHLALARLEQSLGAGFTLITQNVDGLHELAGSKSLLEIHGSIWRFRCTSCGRSGSDRSLDHASPPLCEQCGGILRPDVVWFGESLDHELLARAEQAALMAQVMLVVGTSALVQPAASLAGVASHHGAYVIEVNLEPTPNSSWVNVSFLGKAGEILPELVGHA